MRFVGRYWCLMLAVLALAGLHASALWGGKVLAAEDVLNLFWCDKLRLHNLWIGREAWSDWDPLAFLGLPRLANLQVGWFNAENLYFLLLEPMQAWRFYPFLSDLGLLFSFYFFLRPMVDREAATLAGCFYLMAGDIFKSVQDPPVRTAVIAMLLLLGCHQRWLNSGRKPYLLGVVAMAGWQMVSCAVSQLYFQFLALPFIYLLQIYYCPGPYRLKRGLLAALAFLGSTLAFSFPYFPLLEWSAHGSRKMLANANFSEAYRLNFSELANLFLCDENLALGPAQLMQHGGGYPLSAGFSLAVTGLVLYGCMRGQRAATIVALFLVLQTLGERGGLMWVLHKTVPFTEQIRGPHRFIFGASLVWVQVAAVGLDQLLKRRRILAWGLALWALSVNFWAGSRWLEQNYQDPQIYAGIPLPPAGPGRVIVNFAHPPRPPLAWLSYPITQGRPTMIIPTSAVEGNFFRGMFYSQYGTQADHILSKLAFYSTPLPPLKPRQPLLRSWGLNWVLQSGEAGFGWEYLGISPRHWTVTKVSSAADAASENLWAERSDWEPFEQAIVAGPAPRLGKNPARILSSSDGADKQVIQTSGEASLLITADNWDPNWQCTLDGEPAQVFRANLALKACFVPEGNHQIQWHYRPNWPALALPTVSLGVLLLALALAISHFFHVPVTQTSAPDQPERA